MICIRLIPKASYRTDLRSDTLFGLSLFALSYLLDSSEFEQVIDELKKGKAPFVFSTAFPFTKEKNEFSYYFPKPIIPIESKEFTNRDEYKKLKMTKKIQWIRHDNLVQLLKGEMSYSNWLENESKDSILSGNLKEKKKLVFQVEQLTPHVSIDRVTNEVAEENGAGQFFTTQEKFMNSEMGGLFILAEGDAKLIKSVFRWLQHFGFGGDHAIGKGNFEVQFDKDLPFKISNSGEHALNLSLFSPADEDVDNVAESIIGTQIELRSGKFSKINSSEGIEGFQKPIYPAFKEGSVFKNVEKSLKGKIYSLDNMATHTIFNCMQSIWLKGTIKI